MVVLASFNPDRLAAGLEAPALSEKYSISQPSMVVLMAPNGIPGDRIPTEISLTEALPLSLGTVQTVLRRLTEEGIIERRRGTGSKIADLSDKGRECLVFTFPGQGYRAKSGSRGGFL